jgi:hypothetical protein
MGLEDISFVGLEVTLMGPEETLAVSQLVALGDAYYSGKLWPLLALSVGHQPLLDGPNYRLGAV